ncbi:MAG: hypothetical protein A3F84_26170 [Candidatus Handelsmanbacteria bacterium RIFCSPLOWO2_12_FULL_64_10]|uniref:Uncharacterized protein n=1 Tax=Handelsmanbacteria sp. (strain RIFCSPLOWO2_12_FULL_64_10) TaxID=1817868 RepID=A0A1F6CAG0_HANXR|nr:MAG: hypothetical protein A3F84_26170 [Candidatus Handelsmanbacteria bacterium RIFCSPLOWO2_12_FULL_64_10]
MKTLFCFTALAGILGLVILDCGAPMDPVGGLHSNGGSNSITRAGKPATGCRTIQDGGLMDSAGNPLTLGFDQFGYNYQAHEFNGTYDSVDRVLDGKYWGQTGDYVDDRLRMKWSDDWLSNKDCTGDGKLDRDGASGISKGWLTNQVEGDYVDASGNLQHYTYFVKIVWVGLGGSLWGQYEVIQEVNNDPAGGYHGLQFKAAAPGFGLNDHWTQQ